MSEENFANQIISAYLKHKWEQKEKYDREYDELVKFLWEEEEKKKNKRINGKM